MPLKLILDTRCDDGMSDIPSYILWTIGPESARLVKQRIAKATEEAKADKAFRYLGYECLYSGTLAVIAFDEAEVDENGEDLSEEDLQRYELRLGEEDFPQLPNHQVWIAPESLEEPPSYTDDNGYTSGTKQCDLFEVEFYQDRLIFKASEDDAEFFFESATLYYDVLEPLLENL